LGARGSDMEKAIELFILLPGWFVLSLFKPFSMGPLSGFPALGTICFVAGLVFAIVKEQPRLFLFLIPVALSQALVTAMGLVGESGFWGVDETIHWCFLALQVALSAWLVYHARHVMLAALGLAAFSMIYAVMASFVAATAYHFPAI
jgi:hypothetical protein